MGRYKKELARIHSKKMRKAKEKVRLFRKGELPVEKLTQLAKKYLEKSKRHSGKSA
jgi:hypothetical protein